MSEVFTAVILQIVVLRVMILSSLVGGYQRLGGSHIPIGPDQSLLSPLLACEITLL